MHTKGILQVKERAKCGLIKAFFKLTIYLNFFKCIFNVKKMIIFVLKFDNELFFLLCKPFLMQMFSKSLFLNWGAKNAFLKQGAKKGAALSSLFFMLRLQICWKFWFLIRKLSCFIFCMLFFTLSCEIILIYNTVISSFIYLAWFILVFHF